MLRFLLSKYLTPKSLCISMTFFKRNSWKYNLRLLIAFTAKVGIWIWFLRSVLCFSSLDVHKHISKSFRFPWFEIVLYFSYGWGCITCLLFKLSLWNDIASVQQCIWAAGHHRYCTSLRYWGNSRLYFSEYRLCPPTSFSGHLNLVICNKFPFEMFKVLDKRVILSSLKTFE